MYIISVGCIYLFIHFIYLFRLFQHNLPHPAIKERVPLFITAVTRCICNVGIAGIATKYTKWFRVPRCCLGVCASHNEKGGSARSRKIDFFYFIFKELYLWLPVRELGLWAGITALECLIGHECMIVTERKWQSDGGWWWWGWFWRDSQCTARPLCCHDCSERLVTMWKSSMTTQWDIFRPPGALNWYIFAVHTGGVTINWLINN